MIVYKGKLLKNNSDQKSKLVLSTLVTAWLSIHLWPILLQTLVAIKLESCQTSFPSFCTQPSEVAVLFNLNLSSQFKSAAFSALHRIQFGTCCFVPMSYSTERPMTDRKMERSNGRSFGLQQLLTYSTENLISREEKNWLVRVVAARNLQIIKKLWLSNWVSIVRVMGRFSQASLSLPAATAADSETPCVCVPVWPAQAVPEHCPKSLDFDFSVKTFDCPLE